MSQGSINQPSQQKSGIEGILQALQAVHQVYGINTERTQQKLLAVKLPAEQAKAEAETLSAQAESQYYKEHGIGTTSTTPSNPDSQGTSGGTDTPVTTNPSPLGAVAKQGGFNFVPAKITSMQEAQQKLHNEQTAGAKGDLELGALPGEIAAKKNAPIIAAAADFNKIAAPEIDGLKFASQGRKLLAQGGLITGRAAFDAAVKAGADINRVQTETGQDLSKPLGMIGKLTDAFKEGRDQNLSPEKRTQFTQLINIYDQVNRSVLAQKAFSVAQIHAPGASMEIPDLQQKLLSIASAPPAQTKKGSGGSENSQVDSPLARSIPKGNNPAPKEELVPVIGPGGIPGKIPKSKLEAALGTKKFKLMGTDNAKTAANP